MGRPVAHLVEQVSHVKGCVLAATAADSIPTHGPLLCVIPAFSPPFKLYLSYQIKAKQPRKIS